MNKAECPAVPNCAQAGKLSYAIFSLARAHRSYAAELLRDLGLHPGQELLLMQLFDRDGQTQSELLHSVGLDHSTLSKSLGRMQEAGLLMRVPDEIDKRVWRIRLTGKGRAMRSKIESLWTKLERVSVADLDAATMESFIRIAAKIQKSIIKRDSAVRAA